MARTGWGTCCRYGTRRWLRDLRLDGPRTKEEDEDYACPVRRRAGEGPADGWEGRERIITIQRRGGYTGSDAVRGQAHVYSCSEEVYLCVCTVAARRCICVCV